MPDISLPSLLACFGIEKLNVLQIDVEGFDAEAVKMALSLQPLLMSSTLNACT